MRIAIVGLTHPFRGGISHYTTLLCRALQERHTVRLFALNRQYPKIFFPGRTQLDVSQTPLRMPHEPCVDSINPLSWFITFTKIRRFKPDFIVFSWWHPFFAPAFGTIAYLAWWFAGIPSCYICHNVFPHEPSPVDRLLLTYVFSSGKAFITHSRMDRGILRKIQRNAFILHTHHPTYAAFSTDYQPKSE